MSGTKSIYFYVFIYLFRAKLKWPFKLKIPLPAAEVISKVDVLPPRCRIGSHKIYGTHHSLSRIQDPLSNLVEEPLAIGIYGDIAS